MQGVSVDDDFARFGAKSYAINKITSVEVREKQPHAMGCATLLAIAAALSAVLWLSSLSDASGGVVFFFIAALALGAGAYVQWKRAKIRDYQLFLITSAAETQAYESRNEAEVMDLRNRIESAMMRQSRGL